MFFDLRRLALNQFFDTYKNKMSFDYLTLRLGTLDQEETTSINPNILKIKQFFQLILSFKK